LKDNNPERQRHAPVYGPVTRAEIRFFYSERGIRDFQLSPLRKARVV